MHELLLLRFRCVIGRIAAIAFLLLALGSVGSASAQLADDEQVDRDGITAAALNYAEGWYEGSADRMKAALHPELEKRAVFPAPWGGQQLNQMSAMTLVDATAGGSGRKTPAEKQLKKVTIFEIYGNVASAKVVMADWTDYLHLVKWNGEWKIVNVLWEMTPEMKEQMSGAKAE